MSDARWPWMIPADRSTVGDTTDRARLRRFAHAVRTRTRCETAVDARTGMLFFYETEMDQSRGEPFPYHRPDGTFSLPDLDEVCSTINLGRVPVWLKEKWRGEAEAEAARFRAGEKERFFNERERDAVRIIQRNQNRRGMGRHFRPSVVVNGTKGKVTT